MENIAHLFLEYNDDNEGLSPESWVSQFDLDAEELEYFISLFNLYK